MSSRLWYCQEDGGQWNVPVELVTSFTVDGEVWCVIKGERLIAPRVTQADNGLMVVSAKAVHKIAQ